MSSEQTASVNNMKELMALMEEEDEHNTYGGGCVTDKIEIKVEEDEE
jgi:hypothetical protein